MEEEKKEELREALDNIEKGQPRKKFGGCLKALIIGLIVLAIIGIVLYFLFFSPWALPGTGLKGERQGQINILVMGRGGEGHSGANLTDTIMLLMIRNKEKRIGMLSIPRDLWVETEGYGGSKINAVYAQAKNAGKSDKEAIGLVENHVSEITGYDPHYYALIDFEGLSEIVDTLDGVTVNVDTAFTDTLHSIDYPKGPNEFTGEEAVMYTRARYATSGEGSDFQRADRQQDLIMAIKDKAMTSETLFSPSKLSSLSKQYKKHIITNISVRNLSRMKVLAGDLSDKNTIKAVYSTENVLVSGTSSGGAYILQPKSGDWSETQAFARNMFKDNPSVQVLNGTTNAGKASDITEKLKADGYNIMEAADADKNTYINSLVFDNSSGTYSDTAKRLARKYDAKIVDSKIYEESEADVVVVLGQGEKKQSFFDKIADFFDTSNTNLQ